jgi:hypothetical protein
MGRRAGLSIKRDENAQDAPQLPAHDARRTNQKVDQMRPLAVATLAALTLTACAEQDDRITALAHCNAETLKLYPDPSRVPDEHVFRGNCMREKGYVLRQGRSECNGMLSAQREPTCYERVS